MLRSYHILLYGGDMKKYKYSNELLSEIGKILGGLIKSLGVNKNAYNN